MLGVARRTSAALRPFAFGPAAGQWKGLTFVRTFSAVPPRKTDATRQPTMGQPTTTASHNEAATAPVVPVVTKAQRQAIAVKEAAEKTLTEAKHAAIEAMTVEKVLKKATTDAAVAKIKADAEVQAARTAVSDAKKAMLKADKNAVGVIASTAEQEKRFLENAFDSFDTDKKGFLDPDHIRVVLQALKMPSEPGDVEELVECLDVSKDQVIQKWEWVEEMPVEMQTALHNSSHAAKWFPQD